MSKSASFEIGEALSAIPGWTSPDGREITRTFKLASFPAALVFVATVGHLAERADHHPDILIRYREVQITLFTHSAGGLTEKDFALAQEIDAIA